MIVDTGANIHLVCERQKTIVRLNGSERRRGRLGHGRWQRTKSRRWVASKSTESHCTRALSARWLLTVCSVYHGLRRTGCTSEQGGRPATLYHAQQRRRVPLSRFGVYVLEDASSMVACAVEATQEIKVMAGCSLSHSQDDRS